MKGKSITAIEAHYHKTFIQAMMDMEDIEALGHDLKGFRYFLYKNWIYQQFPDHDYWVGGTNMKDRFNGYFCSISAWERGMSKIIVTEEDARNG